VPDWLTHVVIGLVLIELFSIRKGSLVLLGTLLPDILPKLVLLRLLIPLPDLNLSLFKASHIPFVLFLLTLIVAPLFRYDYKKVVLLLNLGTLSHFIADSLLRHLQPSGIRWLYPFSTQRIGLSLVWPEQSYYILIPAVLFYMGIVLLKKHFNSRLNKPFIQTANHQRK